MPDQYQPKRFELCKKLEAISAGDTEAPDLNKLVDAVFSVMEADMNYMVQSKVKELYQKHISQIRDIYNIFKAVADNPSDRKGATVTLIEGISQLTSAIEMEYALMVDLEARLKVAGVNQAFENIFRQAINTTLLNPNRYK